MKGKSILIISFTPIFSEPRVLRQANLFYNLGFEVLLAGYDGKDPVNSQYSFINLMPKPKTDHSINRNNKFNFVYPFNIIHKTLKNKKQHKTLKYYPDIIDPYIWSKFIYDLSLRIKNKISSLKILIKLSISSNQDIAIRKYWNDGHFQNVYNILEKVKVDYIFSHDYLTAPIAERLAQNMNIDYYVDVHEHALSQDNTLNYMKNLMIKLFDNPFIKCVENEFYSKANGITTVSDGLAIVLKDQYPRIQKLETIRSMPLYESHNLLKSDINSRIGLLYHGILFPGRGLETYIEIMKYLPDKYYLTIRGAGPKSYMEDLQKLIDLSKVNSRVHIEDPVPFNEIIKTANRSDIGLLIMKNTGTQRTINLSNKFFEYIMAGLMICVSNYPEMAAIVDKYSLGILINEDDSNAESVANAIKTISYNEINSFKKNALVAAKELSWETERKKLIHMMDL